MDLTFKITCEAGLTRAKYMFRLLEECLQEFIDLFYSVSWNYTLNEIAKIFFLQCRLLLSCCFNSSLQALLQVSMPINYSFFLLSFLMPLALLFLGFFCEQVFDTASHFVYKCLLHCHVEAHKSLVHPWNSFILRQNIFCIWSLSEVVSGWHIPGRAEEEHFKHKRKNLTATWE